MTGKGRASRISKIRRVSSIFTPCDTPNRLQENGVVPTVAQHLMRHSTIKLTTKTYISSASLPLAEAIRRVPPIVPGIKTDTPIDTLDTPIDTLKPVAPGHSVSQADTSSQNAHEPKTLINKGVLDAI